MKNDGTTECMSNFCAGTPGDLDPDYCNDCAMALGLEL